MVSAGDGWWPLQADNPLTDTVLPRLTKKQNRDNLTIRRNALRRQVFRCQTRRVFAKPTITDEAAVYRAGSVPVHCTTGYVHRSVNDTLDDGTQFNARRTNRW